MDDLMVVRVHDRTLADFDADGRSFGFLFNIKVSNTDDAPKSVAQWNTWLSLLADHEKLKSMFPLFVEIRGTSARTAAVLVMHGFDQDGLSLWFGAVGETFMDNCESLVALRHAVASHLASDGVGV